MMFKPVALSAIGLLAACAITACSHGDDNSNQVRFVLNTPYAPFEFTDSNGELKGFDVDLGKALCKQADLQCSWKTQAWDSLIPSLLSRKADAIMSTMTISDERRQQVLFSDPYLVLPSGWFVPQASTISDISSDGLKGKRIAVQRGTLQDSYVTDNYAADNTIVRYASLDDITIDLQAGRADISFVDVATGQETFIKGNQDKFKRVGDLISEPKKYFGDGIGIAFRPRDQELADKFNKALAELKSNGEYDQLVQHYFPEGE
ncbi:transporter substrate-binding domain-containing protein [Carnimonas nigrificans]|uniref:transporter substrate-binding domain-containing protein n=1 Tax=Carnimonas nigrificans TaxID=64323 RepID=UPI0004B4E8D7